MKNITKKLLALFLSVLLAVSATFVPFSAFGAQLKKTEESVNYVEGEVIAVLKDSTPATYLTPKKAAKNYGSGLKMNKSFTFKKKNGTIRAVVLHSDSKKTKDIIKSLKKNSQVRYAFPNYKVNTSSVTNDSYSDFQWALDNKGHSGGTADLDTQADALWEAAASSEDEQVVAIVDTGIDYNHEDLKDVLWQNPYGSKLVGKYGYDFTDTIKDHSPYDDNGHGSHVAGIIAGTADNAKGISGINKSNVKIMACKFIEEDGSGTTEAALSAFEYISRAIDLGTNVVAINNSWGGYGDLAEQMFFDEIFNNFGEKGAISLVAAGNDGLDLSNVSEDEELSLWFDDTVYETPASSSSEYCLTVAATNEKDELAGFSNYSTEYVDIAAPGTNILSSVSYNCFNPSIYSDEKKAAVVSSMQDYEGTVTWGDFGHPNFFDPVLPSNELFDYLGTELNVETSDDGFALSSSSMEIKLMDEVEEEDDIRVYGFEMPYTIADENKAYSLSFMLKGNHGVYGFISDVPANYDFAKNYDDAPLDAMFFCNKTGNYWDHYFLDINPSAKGYEKNLKSKNRKLVFVFASLSKDTVVNLDDFAISAQNIDAAEFEKYDFYNGTSMATPYVAGAVALVHNAYPDATTAEIVNIVKNTGRTSAALSGKTENAKVLALDNCDKTPAMIISAKYNKDSDVEVKGSFKNDTEFTINGEAVTPKSLTDSLAVFEDTSYNTKKTQITAQNTYGADSITTLLSNKPIPKKSAKVEGAPVASPDFGYYMPLGAISIPAGECSYFVSETGEIGSVSYDGFDDMYYYNDMMLPQIDFSALFTNLKAARVKSAVYLGNKIYFTALNEIYSSFSEVVIGYDSAFGYLDLSTGKTILLCEFPNSTSLGDSLAVYNGAIYLIGGYDIQSNAFSDAVYKYNTSSKSFELTEYTLPEGRAFTNFVQYKDKLFGVYGALENGEMPSVVLFDGTAFTYSAQKLESDDFFEYSFETENTIKVYSGSVGYGTSGVYCNGAYIYGIGDTYYYTMSKDKLSGSKYSFSNSIGERKLIATTLPGAFIAYELETSDSSSDDEELGVYCYGLNNSYAAIDETTLKHASISVYYEPNYAFGDKVSLTLTPESGYIIKSISANGVKLSENSNKATVIMNDYYVSITASTQKVAPDKTKGLKVTSSGKNYVITWKKPARAQGYQVQTYKDGKWKTIKTINSGNTLKYTVAKSKVGKKFRVRAFSKYNSKTYYGAWSDTVKVK